MRKNLLGLEHPDVAGSLHNMGVLYHQQRQYRKAKSLYLPALHIYKQRIGKTHPNTQKLLSWLNDLPEDTEALPQEEFGF